MNTAFVILSLASCLATESYGQGTIRITFDGPPLIPAGAAYTVTSYQESGMSFRPLPGSYGFGRIGADDGSGFPRSGLPDDGTAYLDATSAPAETLIFGFSNNSLFGLVSVDLAEYSTVVPDPVTVQFIGYYADGSTVTTSFTTDGIIGVPGTPDFQTFNFPSKEWSGLTRVEIPTSGWSLDNLVVSVPEPATSVLALCGAVIFGLMRWRKRRRA